MNGRTSKLLRKAHRVHPEIAWKRWWREIPRPMRDGERRKLGEVLRRVQA